MRYPLPHALEAHLGQVKASQLFFSLSGMRRSPLVLSQANRGGGDGEAAGSPWQPASFLKSRTSVMAPVGRGGR